MKGSFLVGTILGILFSVNASAKCLEYTSKVELTGKLIRKVVPGPPDFESIANGDRPEGYFFLVIQNPVCVTAASQAPEELNVGVARLTTIQLNLDNFKLFRPYLGRVVTLKGNLFGAVSAHYHTPVALIDVVLVKAGRRHGR